MKPPDRTLGHRAPLLWIVLPFASGLASAKAAGVGHAGWLLAGATAFALLAIRAARNGGRLWAPTLAIAMALAGGASYVLHRPPALNLRGRPLRQARLTLRLDRVFPPADRSHRTSALATVVGAQPAFRVLLGQRLYLSAVDDPGPPPIRSEVVAVVGTVSAVPPHPAPDSFNGYLDGLGLTCRMLRGRILGREHPPTAYRRFCEDLAVRMNSILGSGLGRHPALAAAFRAMMLGRRRDLRRGDQLLFLRAGAMHLFAINGVHIGVVALACQSLLELARCPAPAAAAATLALLWLDVDTTGTSPSAVRAFLMVAAFAAARILRRPVNALAALAAAFLLVLLVQPLDFFSASFQMSYGVVAALGLFGLPLAARLRRRFPPFPHLPRALWDGPIPPHVRWSRRDRFLHGARRFRGWLHHHLLGALGPGLAAALAAAITGVQFFRLLTPDGLVANLLLVPPAALAITAGFCSIGFGLAGAVPVSRIWNDAAGVLLWLIEAGMRLLTRVPGACLAAHYRAPWIGPAALAGFLAACLAGYASGWRRWSGGFWPPLAVVAIALGLGVRYGT